MPRITRRVLTIGGALLLSVYLVSCSSPASQSSSEPPSSEPPPIPTSEQTLTQSQLPIPDRDKIEQEAPETSEVLKVPTPALPEKQPDSSPTEAEVSSLLKNPKVEEVLQPEPPFNSESPSLAGIILGASEKTVVDRFGPPTDTYDLPSEKEPIEIWEYEGFSIGLNANHAVVYVEILSDQVNSAIHGLYIGMQGSQAAQLLDVVSDSETNVISKEVKGGWFKMDLDPDSQAVLSLKLLSNEI